MKNLDLKSEKGAVLVVEAAIVFPIVFFVVIILLYTGNLFYQQAKVDALSVDAAQYLASLYTDPVLKSMDKNGGAIPRNSTKMNNIQPYRYLLGDKEAEKIAQKYLEDRLGKVGTGLYKGMSISVEVKKAKIKNYVIYQTATVEVKYSINFYPLKAFALPPILKFSAADATAAVDPAEFIRNVDMLMDYNEEFQITKKIKDAVGTFFG